MRRSGRGVSYGVKKRVEAGPKWVVYCENAELRKELDTYAVTGILVNRERSLIESSWKNNMARGECCSHKEGRGNFRPHIDCVS